MHRRSCVAAAVALLIVASAHPAAAQQLANDSFQVQYDGSGIHSLKRTNDLYDTDYIAANGSLGRLIVRYRVTRNGDWRELRELVLAPQRDARTVGYTLGTWLPTLAARSTGGAAVGAAGVRALNDGRRSRRHGRQAAAAAERARVAPDPAQRARPTFPLFTWAGSRGATQWVQYTFPGDENRVERPTVFWTTPPPDRGACSTRTAGSGRKSRPRARTASTPNVFTPVEFAPVKTMALRIEVDDGAGGQRRRSPSGASDRSRRSRRRPISRVDETFTLDGDVLEWTVTLANAGTPADRDRRSRRAVHLRGAHRRARRHLHEESCCGTRSSRGHGSWIYWQRSNGDGPYLVMTPAGQTKFEYFDSSSGAFTPYVHAKAASAAAIAAGGNWRLPVYSLTLAPKGAPGSSVTYTFRFQWAKDVGGRPRRALSAKASSTPTVVPGHGRADPICRRDVLAADEATPIDGDRCRSIRRRRRSKPSPTKNDGLTSIERRSRGSARTC